MRITKIKKNKSGGFDISWKVKPKKEYGKSIEVTGVTFSYSEKGVEYGLQIIAIKRMQKSVGAMSIVTPYKAKYEVGAKKQVEKRKVWDSTDDRIKPLLKEAKKYIDGVRSEDAQESLPLQDSKPKPDKVKKKVKKKH